MPGLGLGRGIWRGNARGALGGGLNPIPALGPAAYFKFNTGIIVTGSGVSQWSDQSGNGRHLLQGTDAARPALQADGSILFDGVAQFLKCGAFTLNQPETVYVRGKHATWTINERIFDGNTSASGFLFQSTSTPGLAVSSGSASSVLNDLALGAYGTVCALFNGASSIFRANNSETSGNFGAANMSGFTLGSNGTGAALFSNIQIKEVAIFAAAHDAATRAAVIAYLSTL